jgi:uncharacterized protein
MNTRRLGTGFVIAALVLSIAVIAIAAAKVPKLSGRVNDYADVLDSRQESQIEQALASFEQQTTTQVVLLTTPSLEGEDIAGYSLRVVEAWKLGQKGKDNGVLLTVAPTERKVRIEVGYGLEGALTDAESAQIIRYAIVPAFKRGDLYGGIVGGLDGIMKATVGEFTAPKHAGRGYDKGDKPSLLSMILMGIIFVVMMSTRTGRMLFFTMMIFGGRGGSGSSGGGFGGGGGGFGGGGASGSW